jgi:DNA-binding transcriptional regulator YdaS (Cro superfamily)
MEATEVAAAVQALGGIRAAARALQCSPASIANYCAGRRPVSVETERDLRMLAGGGVHGFPLTKNL